MFKRKLSTVDFARKYESHILELIHEYNESARANTAEFTKLVDKYEAHFNELRFEEENAADGYEPGVTYEGDFVVMRSYQGCVPDLYPFDDVIHRVWVPNITSINVETVDLEKLVNFVPIDIRESGFNSRRVECGQYVVDRMKVKDSDKYDSIFRILDVIYYIIEKHDIDIISWYGYNDNLRAFWSRMGFQNSNLYLTVRIVTGQQVRNSYAITCTPWTIDAFLESLPRAMGNDLNVVEQ